MNEHGQAHKHAHECVANQKISKLPICLAAVGAMESRSKLSLMFTLTPINTFTHVKNPPSVVWTLLGCVESINKGRLGT